jgi:hypothetical protein
MMNLTWLCALLPHLGTPLLYHQIYELYPSPPLWFGSFYEWILLCLIFPSDSIKAIFSLLRCYLVACQSFILGFYCLQSLPCDSIGLVDRAVGRNWFVLGWWCVFVSSNSPSCSLRSSSCSSCSSQIPSNLWRSGTPRGQRPYHNVFAKYQKYSIVRHVQIILTRTVPSNL